MYKQHLFKRRNHICGILQNPYVKYFICNLTLRYLPVYPVTSFYYMFTKELMKIRNDIYMFKNFLYDTNNENVIKLIKSSILLLLNIQLPLFTVNSDLKLHKTILTHIVYTSHYCLGLDN